jgi:hyperosmotically inducible periplasmic protein
MKGTDMMTIQKLLFGCVALLCSSMIYAQSAASSSGAVGQAGTASVSQPGAGKKAVRAANRQFSTAIEHAIYKDQNVEDVDIVAFGNVATGKVILSGFISDPSQEQTAINAARKVPGVTSVKSVLTLREEGN